MRNVTKVKQIKIIDYKFNDNYHSQQASSSNLSTWTVKKISLNSTTILYYDQDLKLASTGVFEIPLESQPTDCLLWTLFPRQIWSITLNELTRVHYIRIKLYGDNIEDFHHNGEIIFDLLLKNITTFEINNNNNQQQIYDKIKLPTEIKCQETIPSTSQYVDPYQQKYSANYLVIDFLCEIEDTVKSTIDYTFSNIFEVDQLYVNAIDIRFTMVDMKQDSSISSASVKDTKTTTILNNNNNDYKNNINNYSTLHKVEFKQRISKISLCELKVYTFNNDCGSPDMPVNALVKREYTWFNENVQKTYNYACLDKNRELKGMFNNNNNNHIKYIYIVVVFLYIIYRKFQRRMWKLWPMETRISSVC